jgi:hypothetical protein
MTSQLSNIVLGTVFVAVFVGYIIGRATTPTIESNQAASALHAKAWGRQWPQSEGTIAKTEISDESGSVDDHNIDGSLADKLVVPLHFNYQYFEEIQSLKSALGAQPDQDEEDVLVVRQEYEILRQALEGDLKDYRSIVVTGHPGIGSYETRF